MSQDHTAEIQKQWFDFASREIQKNGRSISFVVNEAKDRYHLNDELSELFRYMASGIWLCHYADNNRVVERLISGESKSTIESEMALSGDLDTAGRDLLKEMLDKWEAGIEEGKREAVAEFLRASSSNSGESRSSRIILRSICLFFGLGWTFIGAPTQFAEGNIGEALCLLVLGPSVGSLFYFLKPRF